MISIPRVLSPATFWRALSLALILMMSLFFLFPGKSEAHAILLRSDPARDAVLPRAPTRVRLWFSEDLNRSLSTVSVENSANAQVDLENAHVLLTDATEIDLDLKSALDPSVYTVRYRSVASDDGHIMTGSFHFTIAGSAGMLPQLHPVTHAGGNALGTTNAPAQTPSLFDGIVFLNVLMLTLVELGAVFYVGAAIWQLFVLRLPSSSDSGCKEASQRAQERFARLLALPAAGTLLLANSGVLVGQALTVTGGNWGQAFAPALLLTLSTSGHFGFFWLLREVVLVLVLLLTLVQWHLRQRAPRLTTVFSWTHLLFGLTFFGALTLSSHAAAASPDKVTMAVLADWLHLIAAALWVGGMLYLALNYLPAQHKQALAIQAQALTTVLPRYSPWAIAGVLLMAVTGPLSATVHLTSWEQVWATAYGLALVAKGCFVGGLVITSAVHVFLLRPRLKNAFGAYTRAHARLRAAEAVAAQGQGIQSTALRALPVAPRHLISEMNFCEEQLTKHTRRLTGVLQWEPLLGVAVLACVSLMNVFAGSLAPVGASSPSLEKIQKAQFSAFTTDRQFLVRLDVTPGQIGSNGFLAQIEETATGKLTGSVSVALVFSSLDMNMRTTIVGLQSDEKGSFRATDTLAMGGNWRVRIQVRTRDNALHEASVQLQIPPAKA